MGKDPATSVVNAYGLAHEVPNLLIMGGSILVSHGGSNPTLTIQAVTWRNTEHLIANWGSIAKSAPLRPSPKRNDTSANSPANEPGTMSLEMNMAE